MLTSEYARIPKVEQHIASYALHQHIRQLNRVSIYRCSVSKYRWYWYIGAICDVFHCCNLAFHGKSSFGRPPFQYFVLVRGRRGWNNRNAYKPQFASIDKFETTNNMASSSMIRSIVDARPTTINNPRFFEHSCPICMLKGPCRLLVVMLALPTEDGWLSHMRTELAISLFV